MAREAIAAGLGAQEYGNRFWMNDAKPSGGWIEYPGKIVDRATRENLAESIKSAISGQNRHRILTLDQGMKYHEVGMSNRDSQFLTSAGRRFPTSSSRASSFGRTRCCPGASGGRLPLRR
jgi:phage portal protein BeeE